MINFLRFTLCSFLYLFSIATLNLQTLAQKPTDGLPASITVNDVSGFWTLNSAESDDPFEKMQQLVRAGASAPSDEKAKKLPPMTQSIFHPDALILVGGQGDITINEAFRDIVETRTVYTDGVTRTFAVAAGVNYSVMSRRTATKLIVETVSPRGNKLVEGYETTAGGRKLRVTVRVEDSAGNELITLHRTYERAVADVFGGDAGVVQ